MKLQSLIIPYCSLVAAQDEANLAPIEDESAYINPYIWTLYPGLDEYAPEEEETEMITQRSRGGRHVESIVIDQAWRQYDRRTEMIFQTLFENLVNSTEYQDNEDKIRAQDEEICKLGFDPAFPDVRVKCDKSRSFPTPKIKYMTPARKFKTLKLVVLWLQKKNEFGRYCYYGCHCLPEGSHNLAGLNYGVPVDSIDRSCKNFFQCYECAKMENPKCQGDRVKYKYALNVHKLTGQKSIDCLNKKGSCARNICECDKRWSENLAIFEEDFNPFFHKTRGKDFNPRWVYNNECKRAGKGKFGKPETCCGTSYPDMMPLQKGKECCGHRPYDPNGDRQCCSGNKIRQTCDAQ